MAVKIVMPKFGFSMEEGIVGSWLVKEGDVVKRGDALASIESEKLVNEAVADSDGIVVKLLLEEGDSAPVGDPICILAQPGEDISAMLAELSAPTTPNALAESAVETQKEVAEWKGQAPNDEKKISPRAKKLANQNGLDYSNIPGTGLLGMIELADIKKALEQQAAKKKPVEARDEVRISPKALKYAQEKNLVYAHIAGTGYLGIVTLEDVRRFGKPADAVNTPQSEKDETVRASRMRQTIARNMLESLRSSAQLTNFSEFQVGGLQEQYAVLKERYAAEGVKLSYTAMILSAAAIALREQPLMRLQQTDGATLVRKASVDIGVAVDLPEGLVVPVIRNVDRKDLKLLCRELAQIAARARDGALTEGDFSGACMTVSNLGMYGVQFFTPVLNAPESLLLGVGAMAEKPIAKDGGIYLVPMLPLSLTYDHRVIDGAPAARFVHRVGELLNETQWY